MQSGCFTNWTDAAEKLFHETKKTRFFSIASPRWHKLKTSNNKPEWKEDEEPSVLWLIVGLDKTFLDESFYQFSSNELKVQLLLI